MLVVFSLPLQDRRRDDIGHASSPDTSDCGCEREADGESPTRDCRCDGREQLPGQGDSRVVGGQVTELPVDDSVHVALCC